MQFMIAETPHTQMRLTKNISYVYCKRRKSEQRKENNNINRKMLKKNQQRLNSSAGLNVD